MSRLLVIDDDIELCELLDEYLTAEGFTVETVNVPETGIERALSGDHSLVVLDVMLPGMSGFNVLRRIREQSGVPILMLTARGDDVDRIVGLEMGADDYLAKPFNPRELVARIRAIQRRAEPPHAREAVKETREPMILGDLKLDARTRTVLLGDMNVGLTAVEFNLLEVLLRAAGRVIPRDVLARTVLGRDLSPYDRSIDVHVSSLRRKLGPRSGGSERIKTIRGVGYLYVLPPDGL